MALKQLLSTFTLCFITSAIFSQTSDSTRTLNEVIIKALRTQREVTRLDSIKGTFIYSGKKNEVINLTAKDAALTEKYGRQIFAKIPGVFVYDMDGTGNQINISTRGLDPHRGWEFNTRKDGILTNSDTYGYPASHYNIPMEAVERIELVRGTGSLQYGAQFGGMLNYVSKQPDSTRAFSFESINTIGSYGLLSTFNSASGTVGRLKYFAWFNGKKNTGYRRNANSNYDAQNLTLYYQGSKNLLLKAEYTRSNYLIHLAGPLTDAQFRTDPRFATRSRNYYNPEIHIPSLTLDWKPSRTTTVNFTSSAVLGNRNSVIFDKPATIADTVNSATLAYNNRQVDIDKFNSFTSELRVLQSYNLFSRTSSLAAGIQYMNNDLHRRQLGTGTTGSDFDLSLAVPGWGRDMHYRTGNIALFIENRFALLPRFSINLGLRNEIGETEMTGIIKNYPANDIPNTINHNFPLLGANAQYNISTDINLYGGWTQAYRPVIFKDIIPTSTFEIADKNLKDAHGYNIEAGIRGKKHLLSWDVSYFRLFYKNRLGTLAQTNNAGELTIFKTNIGNSLTEGLELFAELNLPIGRKANLSIFTATAYMDAKYINASVRSGNSNVNIEGNRVESAPEWQSRNGVTLRFPALSLSLLSSYTGKTFADALNSVVPSSSGATGIVPSYHILDFNAKINLSKMINARFNVNNAFNKSYFTKRPQFYPGPGIWPSDARSYSLTLGIRL